MSGGACFTFRGRDRRRGGSGWRLLERGRRSRPFVEGLKRGSGGGGTRGAARASGPASMAGGEAGVDEPGWTEGEGGPVVAAGSASRAGWAVGKAGSAGSGAVSAVSGAGSAVGGVVSARSRASLAGGVGSRDAEDGDLVRWGRRPERRLPRRGREEEVGSRKSTSISSSEEEDEDSQDWRGEGGRLVKRTMA